MVSISVCMIVKGEEAALARCLDSVQGIADEIVIVDTGSADRTREIAAGYGRVLDFAWCDDFSAARNFSFAQATKDYVLWLDADDVIVPADRERFLALKAQLDGTEDVVMLPYHTAFDGTGRPTFTYYRERLLRRAAGFQWQGAVHECITPSGKVVYGDAAVEHHKEKQEDSGRNLRIYQSLLDKGELLDVRASFYYARELMTHEKYEQAVQAFKSGAAPVTAPVVTQPAPVVTQPAPVVTPAATAQPVQMPQMPTAPAAQMPAQPQPVVTSVQAPTPVQPVMPQAPAQMPAQPVAQPQQNVIPPVINNNQKGAL